MLLEGDDGCAGVGQGDRELFAGADPEHADDAERTIAETRQYLEDAEELLQTEQTAVDFFNAMIERYPNHLGRTVLWAAVQTLYGYREHLKQDIRQIVNSWL